MYICALSFCFCCWCCCTYFAGGVVANSTHERDFIDNSPRLLRKGCNTNNSNRVIDNSSTIIINKFGVECALASAPSMQDMKTGSDINLACDVYKKSIGNFNRNASIVGWMRAFVFTCQYVCACACAFLLRFSSLFIRAYLSTIWFCCGRSLRSCFYF